MGRVRVMFTPRSLIIGSGLRWLVVISLRRRFFQVFRKGRGTWPGYSV